MKSVQLELVESEVRFIFEALLALENKWAAICESSDDADEISDYGNDLIELRLLLKSLKSKTVPVLGNNVLNFSREPI